MDNGSSRVIRNKLGLINLAQELGNVSKACKIMGLCRTPMQTLLAGKSAWDEKVTFLNTRT